MVVVVTVMQVSESQCSSLIGAVQLSGAWGWMSNVMFGTESPTLGPTGGVLKGEIVVLAYLNAISLLHHILYIQIYF